MLFCNSSHKAASWQQLAFFSKNFHQWKGATPLLTESFCPSNILFFPIRSASTLFTDHKPLVSAEAKSKTSFSSRQQCQLAFLSEYHVCSPTWPPQCGSRHTITAISATSHHITTTCHPISSRHFTCHAHPLIFFLCHFLTLTWPRHNSHAQCPCIHPHPARHMPSLHITSIPLTSQLTFLGESPQQNFGPLIPIQFQHQIFNHIHSLGLPGIRAPHTPSHFLSFCLVPHYQRHHTNGHTRSCTT